MVKIKLSEDGYLNIYYTKNSKGEFRHKAKMHWSEVNVSSYDGSNRPEIRFWCKNAKNAIYGEACVNITQDYSPYNKVERWHRFSTNDNYTNKKLYNAFTFLFSEIKASEKYNRNDDDPFAPENYNTKPTTVFNGASSEKVDLETLNGVYKVWVKIGTLKKHFVLDSGASEISLSTSIERELIANGIIKRDDYIEPALYKIADGSIIKCRRLIIPEMTIGNYKIKNVTASIGVSDSPLLLGRSFLDNFSKWSIDNKTKELILEK